MELIAWILLLVVFVLCLRLRGRVARLEQRIDALESPTVVRAPGAAHVVRPPEVVRVRSEEPQRELEPSEPIRVAAPERVLPPPPPVEPTPHMPEPRHRARGFGFEDVFGRHLPIWAGGVTLIVAGVLIVKYSIDAGLLSPLVRVIAGLLFGSVLIVGAEAALRSERHVRDRRIAQSLAGAGVATLYSSILVAANLYHLVAPGGAFAGLVVVTLLAAGLSLRFGAPTALLGLIGGLAAPALVGAQSPNVPLLATYLAFIVGGLAALGRTQRWPWLGSLAIAGGFGWSLVLLVSGVASTEATIAAGLFTLLLAIAFPLLLIGEKSRLLRLAAALAGCIQMAALVAIGGFAGLDWALYGLIAAATVWLSRREPLFAKAPLAGITIGLFLTLAWSKPDPIMLAAVLAGGALIHGVPALLRLWRAEGRLSDAAQIAIAALGIAVVPFAHFDGKASDIALAVLALAGSLLAGGAAALGWRNEARTGDARFATLALTGSALALFAAAIVAPDAALAPLTAIAALATLLLARSAIDRRVETGAQILASLGILLLIFATGDREIARAFGMRETARAFGDLARWIVPALAALGFARWSTAQPIRQLAAGVAPALGYVALAQVVPIAWMPLIPATMLAALALVPLRREALLAPIAVAGAIALAWAAQPLLLWLSVGGLALAGMPLHVTALPAWRDALIHLGAPTLALAALLWRGTLPEVSRRYGGAALAVLGVVTAHILWKQVFAIATLQGFTAWGMAERSLWEILLLAAAFGAGRLAWRNAALGLALAALLHFGWFSLLVHDPLWTPQAVGPWLLPAYACAWLAAWLVTEQVRYPLASRIETAVRIVLILFFAASVLRQLFHGSMLWAGAVTQTEDIARSLVAILIAVGFLWWGIARADRDWRIASLVLMLAAVAKVFLFDAAGLEGLLRIASFIALGLSLILVGWIYSRFLPDSQLTGAQDAADSVDETQG